MSEIVVRHVKPEDAAALMHIYSQPDTMANTLHLPLPSLQKWQERLSNLSPAGHSLVACIEEKVVGQLTLDVIATARRRHCATLGMGVDQTCRNRGVGKALLGAAVDLCDNWLQVTRMELTVFTDNAAAIALYRHFGFEIEGTGKGFAMRQGEMVDAHYMARLK
ncbi:GNAT family N-acetyltransferase [Candidatus Pantoea deserta]|uniref:GNAT family N-acetyltransferase n=1 Tax=Candidatus Pantoea deserta TaxID=1869313 RepID=A0A3N4NZI5_9GAMM|nr:GNAT family N-acetyltransferase [Pantoea deserta]RPE01455.1 GNAT family N-acetyltransferase [Pantoea deserta]